MIDFLKDLWETMWEGSIYTVIVWCMIIYIICSFLKFVV